MRSLLLAVVCAAFPARGADGLALLELRDLTQAVLADMRAGKAEALVAHGHPAWVSELGGPEKARRIVPKLLARELAGLRAKGFHRVAFSAGEPRVIAETEARLFVLVPMTTVAEGDRGTITGVGHMLAIRGEGGKGRWSLINIRLPEPEMRRLVPELPKDAKLPAPERAVFTPRAPAP